jgi:hypothetical protein
VPVFQAQRGEMVWKEVFLKAIFILIPCSVEKPWHIYAAIIITHHPFLASLGTTQPTHMLLPFVDFMPVLSGSSNNITITLMTACIRFLGPAHQCSKNLQTTASSIFPLAGIIKSLQLFFFFWWDADLKKKKNPAQFLHPRKKVYRV